MVDWLQVHLTTAEAVMIVLTFIALVVAGFAAWYARESAKGAERSASNADRSATSAERSNQIAVLAEFLREFREMEPARRRVIRSRAKVSKVRLADLEEPLRSEATQIAYYLDALGLLVRSELIETDPIYSILGKPIERAWESLEPYIKLERVARDEPRFMAGFEDLAVGAHEYDYDADLAKLRTFHDETDEPR